MAETVDAVVLGMGPGGEAAAAQLAQAGLDVVGIEAHLVGGECPYYGCIPSKMMIRAADSLAEARRVPLLAGASRISPDFAPVATRIREEATTNWNDQIAVDRFTATGGRFVRGRGRLTGPATVTVDGQEYTARRGILINTGTQPAIPPIDGLADTPYWTNREAIAATQAPNSLAVLGAGVVGLELAQAFARFGTRVSVIEAADRVLPAEEPEAAELLSGVLAIEGIQVRTATAARRVRHDESGFTLDLGEADPVRADRLLVATGRRADLAGLGVDALGLDPQARVLQPDERLRIAEGVWAIGDITGKGAFTHISVYQAGIAARDILGETTPLAEYHAVPRVIFTDPEVGAVGLTESQARAQGLRIQIGQAALPSSARGFIHHVGNQGFVKLVEDTDRGVLVGATTAGPAGGEVLSLLTLAVHAAIPVETLRQMIYAYPTFHRAVEDALRTLP